MNAHAKSARILAITLSAALPMFFLAGCVSTRINITTLEPMPKGIGELDLAGIEFESIYSYTQSLAEVEAIIVSSARANGIAIRPRQATPLDAVGGNDASRRNSIMVFAREQSFTKGFKTVNSLAIIADVRNPEGKAITRAEWFHDGEESFDSLGYLASSMNATFKRLSRAMQKAK